jgi:hypothetical protein
MPPWAAARRWCWRGRLLDAAGAHSLPAGASPPASPSPLALPRLDGGRCCGPARRDERGPRYRHPDRPSGSLEAALDELRSLWGPGPLEEVTFRAHLNQLRRLDLPVVLEDVPSATARHEPTCPCFRSTEKPRRWRPRRASAFPVRLADLDLHWTRAAHTVWRDFDGVLRQPGPRACLLVDRLGPRPARASPWGRPDSPKPVARFQSGARPRARRHRRKSHAHDPLQPGGLSEAPPVEGGLVSLILEALKKLERERQSPDRGFLVLGPGTWSEAPPDRRRTAAVVLGAVALGAAAGTAFWHLRDARAERAVSQPPAPASLPAAAPCRFERSAAAHHAPPRRRPPSGLARTAAGGEHPLAAACDGRRCDDRRTCGPCGRNPVGRPIEDHCRRSDAWRSERAGARDTPQPSGHQPPGRPSGGRARRPPRLRRRHLRRHPRRADR